MAYTKYAAFGSSIKVGGTTIKGVTDIVAPGMEPNMIDVTTHDSTSAFEEVVAGILKSGDASFSVVFDPGEASHATTLVAAITARAVLAIIIGMPTSPVKTITFNGYLSLGGMKMPVNGPMTMDIKIKATGAVAIV